MNKKETSKITNESVVRKTSEILLDKKNAAWKEIYMKYVKGIIENQEVYKKCAKFHVNKPLVVYSTMSKVKTDSKIKEFDLRFAGQSVGLIKIQNKNGVLKRDLTVSADKAKRAKDNFGFTCSKELKRVDWLSNDAREFRRFYYGCNSTVSVRIKSEEHRVESFLLNEFNKKTRAENKKLCNIKPVKLGGKFFQFSTALVASGHDPKIAITETSSQGGGIDILARVRHNKDGNRSRIAVIEIKDENNKNEPQEDVMFQALIYATFVGYLLCPKSECRNEWYKIFFNFNEKAKLPDGPLNIDVVTLMPKSSKDEAEETESIEIDDGSVILHPYTLYYKKDIDGNPVDFSGTLCDVLRK